MFYNIGKGSIGKTLNLRTLFICSLSEGQILMGAESNDPMMSHLKNILQVGKLTSAFHALSEYYPLQSCLMQQTLAIYKSAWKVHCLSLEFGSWHPIHVILLA